MAQNTYREEYIRDFEEYGDEYHTTPYWRDECRASITAAKITPNLNQAERKDLVMEAAYRAHEFGQMLELEDEVKELVYGYSNEEKNITRTIPRINYVVEPSNDRVEGDRGDKNIVSKMSKTPKTHDDYER